MSSSALPWNRGQRSFFFLSSQQTNVSQSSSSYLDLDRSSLFRPDTQFVENQLKTFEGFRVGSIPLSSFATPSMPEFTPPTILSSSTLSPCLETDSYSLGAEQWADSMLQQPKVEG